MKAVLRAWVPPAVLGLYRRFRPRIRWSGHYATWTDAQAQTRGYEDPDLLNRIRSAVRTVLAGKGSFERDGVVFTEESPNLPLVASLSRASFSIRKGVQVVDFGGGLGSGYLQNRKWLDNHAFRWIVIEQPHFAQAGRELFSDAEIQFESGVSGNLAEGERFLLLSSVLQYLPEPEKTLGEILMHLQPRWIFFDRTPYWPGPGHRLTVQEVPAEICAGSYPCWFFDKSRLEERLLPRYRKLHEFRTDDECLDFPSSFEGSFWERVDQPKN